jgi:alkylhydroperoxidase family enzyme
VWHRLVVDQWGVDGAASLRAYAPTAADRWARVVRATWAGDTGEVAAIAAVVAEPHGLLPLPSPVDVTAGVLPPALRAFARQVATDVASLTDEQRAAAMAEAGPRAFALTQIIWVVDLGPRMAAALDALFSPSEPAAQTPGTAAADLWPALEDFARAVARLDALDDVTSELVRLRGASQHDCRLCRSRRSQAAITAGADDATFAAVDGDRARLTDSQRAALALVDAMVWTPGAIPAEVVAELRRTLRPEQAVEVVLDVVRNAQNKIAVALGADAANVTSGVELYDLSDEGDVVVVGVAGV